MIYDPSSVSMGRRCRVFQVWTTPAGLFYTGTMSKILYPSLRLGFMVAPPQIVDTPRQGTRGYGPSIPSD